MNYNKCCDSNCDEKAILFSDFCYKHTVEKETILEKILKYINENKKLNGINLAYVPLVGVDFSNKDISFSKFSHCDMGSSTFINTTMVSTFLDFTNLQKAIFNSANIKLSVLGGADLRDSVFDESIVVFCNFLGANINGVKFQNTDLSQSRFINSNNESVLFHNCNLKKTVFSKIIFNEKSLKTSNCEDCIISEESDDNTIGKGIKI